LIAIDSHSWFECMGLLADSGLTGNVSCHLSMLSIVLKATVIKAQSWQARIGSVVNKWIEQNGSCRHWMLRSLLREQCCTGAEKGDRHGIHSWRERLGSLRRHRLGAYWAPSAYKRSLAKY
jgi:hypothetical protein